MKSASSIYALAAILCLCGDGCFTTVTTEHVAQTLPNSTPDQSIAQQDGFGDLPLITHPQNHAMITLGVSLPEIPPNVTVIRLRRGAPNDTEMRNIAGAIGIPNGTVSDQPSASELSLSWNDDQGYHWTYDAESRELEFSEQTTTATPLTVSALPANQDIIDTANSFLLARLFDLTEYRTGLVEPDWNNWWYTSKVAGLCMDTASLSNVRALASSDPLIAGNPPVLPLAVSSTCVLPEFPSRAVVRYGAFVDQRDIVQADGSLVNGIELVLDTTHEKVGSGRISLFPNPDRSDYPGLTPAEATALLQAGGVTPVSGNVMINAIDFASYKLDAQQDGERITYLIPALVATGARTLPDGSTETVRIVAPLLKQ